jgi:hypothetical protein
MRQQSAGWITEDRVRVYGVTIAVLELVVLAVLLWRCIYLPDAKLNISFGSDFRVFWSAAHLALSGDPADVYDLSKMFAARQAIDSAETVMRAWHGWFYPPTFLLAILPAGWFPWWVALIAFMGSTLAAYLAVIRKMAAPYPVWWFALGFPPVIFTIILGQNSFLTAALAGAALVLLDRRPALSGLCLGLLAMKPHLAILFPIALAAGGHWRVIRAATLTVAVFVGTSILFLGVGAGESFLHAMGAARAAVLEPYWPRLFMPTVYAGAVNLGASDFAANVLQLGCSVGAASAVVWCWRRSTSTNIRNSALILGSILASPHLFSYDLTWLAFPIIWMTAEGLRNGWESGERGALVFAWLAPLLLMVPGALLGANPTPIIPAVLLAYTVIRVRRQSTTIADTPAAQLVA